MTSPRTTCVGVFCGCDVENYGDVLFPALARHELESRLPGVEVRAYGYRDRQPPGWPYVVRSLSRLIEEIGDLDLLLIGGGQIVRWDRELPPEYMPPSPLLQHPTSLWLVPTLVGLAHGVPVAWNAPGVFPGPPRWGRSLAAAAVRDVHHLAVRDGTSAGFLGELAPGAPVRLVPDTAFGIAALLPAGPTPAYSELCERAGLKRPYAIVQPSPPLAQDRARLESALRHFRDAGLVLLELPVSPCNGDAVGVLGIREPMLQLPSRPLDPLLFAELITNAEAVVGPSFHLAVTAVVAGVSVNRPTLGIGQKYEVLADLAGVHVWPEPPQPIDLRHGRIAPDAIVRERAAMVSEHWDRVAALVGGRASGARNLARYLAELPAQLERLADVESKLREEEALRRTQQAELNHERQMRQAATSRLETLTSRRAVRLALAVAAWLAHLRKSLGRAGAV